MFKARLIPMGRKVSRRHIVGMPPPAADGGCRSNRAPGCALFDPANPSNANGRLIQALGVDIV
jgi:hypothetical protein